MGKYLLSLPGVDVDFRNDAGKTTLLVIVSEANRSGSSGGDGSGGPKLTSSLLNEVKELVEERCADPTVADHSGKNALHYLCAYDCKPEASHDKAEGGTNVFARVRVLMMHFKLLFYCRCVQERVDLQQGPP